MCPENFDMLDFKIVNNVLKILKFRMQVILPTDIVLYAARTPRPTMATHVEGNVESYMKRPSLVKPTVGPSKTTSILMMMRKRTTRTTRTTTCTTMTTRTI